MAASPSPSEGVKVKEESGDILENFSIDVLSYDTHLI